MGRPSAPSLPPPPPPPKEDDPKITEAEEKNRIALAKRSSRASTKLTGPGLFDQGTTLRFTKLGGVP